MELKLNSHATYILACSGGADSVFLGEQLWRQGFTKVLVAHFNHNLRGEESQADEDFCCQKAQDWAYEFRSETWKNPLRSEESCRYARYQFLEKVRKQEKADFILLAHHADDQAETILFNFLRGTGLKGLGGMQERDGFLLRPLLSLSKAEILQFLEQKKIAYREDSSNLNREFARNFIRLDLFPLIEERFPQAKIVLNRSARIFAAHAESLVREAQIWLQKNNSPSQGIERRKFLSLSAIQQAEVLRQIWLPKTLDFEQVQQLKDFALNAQSGKKMSLKNKTLQVYTEALFFS